MVLGHRSALLLLLLVEVSGLEMRTDHEGDVEMMSRPTTTQEDHVVKEGRKKP